ncbi:hypothetical protein J2Y48_004454 [Mycoplana sp. BE70]|nr:hypothetical protein [Mycoplana sp. BE70]
MLDPSGRASEVLFGARFGRSHPPMKFLNAVRPLR